MVSLLKINREMLQRVVNQQLMHEVAKYYDTSPHTETEAKYRLSVEKCAADKLVKQMK